MKVGRILIITAIVFVVAAVMSAAFLSASGMKGIQETQNYNEEEIFTENIKSVQIDLVSTDVSVLASQDDSFVVKHKGTCTQVSLTEQNYDPELKMEVENSKLMVNMDYPMWNFFTFSVDCNDKVIVLVPERFKGDINIKQVSGDTEIDTYALSKLLFNGVSGDVKTISSFDETNINTVSGDVSVSYPESADIETVSGDVTLALAPGTPVSFDSVSGDVNGENTQSRDAKIKVNTVSGDLEVKK